MFASVSLAAGVYGRAMQTVRCADLGSAAILSLLWHAHEVVIPRSGPDAAHPANRALRLAANTTGLYSARTATSLHYSPSGVATNVTPVVDYGITVWVRPDGIDAVGLQRLPIPESATAP